MTLPDQTPDRVIALTPSTISMFSWIIARGSHRRFDRTRAIELLIYSAEHFGHFWWFDLPSFCSPDSFHTNLNSFIETMKHLIASVSLIVMLTPPHSEAQYIPQDFFNDAHKSNLGFWPNNGQVIDTDGQLSTSVKYVSHGGFPRVYLQEKSKTSFVIRVNDPSQQDTLHRLDMVPVGANARDVEPIAQLLKDVTHRYYLPHCPNGIVAEGYNRIVYEGVYPNIDFHYYGASSGQRMAIVCRPGSNPTDVRLQFTGQDSLGIDVNGFLRIHSNGRYITLPYALAYQINSGGTPVALGWTANYTADNGTGWVTLSFASYDPTKALILQVGGLPAAGGGGDPALEWSTLIGTGNGIGSSEFITAGDADEEGNLYVAGNTRDQDFPANTGVTLHEGNSEMVFGKFLYAPNDEIDARLDYLTFFGGTGNDKAVVLHSTSVGGVEMLYLGGWTSSENIPVRPINNPNDNSFYQEALRGSTDGFALRFFASSGEVPRSTYFGGEGSEMITSVTEDRNGDIYFAGATTSTVGEYGIDCTSPATGFPMCSTEPDSYQEGTNAGGTDGFIFRLDDQFRLTWSTFIGGPGDDLFFDAAYFTSAASSLDRIALAGSSTGLMPFGPSNGYHVSSNTTETGVIFTFDSNCRKQWGTFLPGVLRLEAVINDKTNFLVMGLTKFQAATELTCNAVANTVSICTPSTGAYQDAFINRHDAYFGEFELPTGTLKWSTVYGDLGWLGSLFPDENTGPDYFQQQQQQPFPIYRFSDLEVDTQGNLYAMGLYQHGFWDFIDDDQSTLFGYGLYNQEWDLLTGSNQTDLTLFLFDQQRALHWASLYGGGFEHVDAGPPGSPFDLVWYFKGCEFGQDLVLVPEKALYWVGTSGGVALPEACPNPELSWCEASLNAVGDNLDPMQGFAVRMDLREIAVHLHDVAFDQSSVIHALPNPADAVVRFRTQQTTLSRAQVLVVNALGQTVFIGSLDENGSLDVQHLASGSYVAQIIAPHVATPLNVRFVRQ